MSIPHVAKCKGQCSLFIFLDLTSDFQTVYYPLLIKILSSSLFSRTLYIFEVTYDSTIPHYQVLLLIYSLLSNPSYWCLGLSLDPLLFAINTHFLGILRTWNTMSIIISFLRLNTSENMHKLLILSINHFPYL